MVRVSNYRIYDGKTDYQECSEAVETGTIFDFSNLGTYSVTKLYSEKYENCLWINIDSGNITFEELCEDFEIYDDYIITQGIHMEYVVDIGEVFITHLDHEYIYYTVEEYEKRCKDVKQKGEGYPRFKSFKIDNARIPFLKRCFIENKDKKVNVVLRESEQFLCYVLESYFIHKDLLIEYFQLMKEKGDDDNV